VVVCLIPSADLDDTFMRAQSVDTSESALQGFGNYVLEITCYDRAGNPDKSPLLDDRVDSPQEHPFPFFIPSSITGKLTTKILQIRAMHHSHAVTLKKPLPLRVEDAPLTIRAEVPSDNGYAPIGTSAVIAIDSEHRRSV
jgi:hypothetical protein